jgi:hypothetical protein
MEGISEIMVSAAVTLVFAGAGFVGFVRSGLSKITAQISAIEEKLREHKLNTDAHVTRGLVQETDRRFAALEANLGGPSEREWGHAVSEMEEIRHDLRNQKMATDLLTRDVNECGGPSK